MVRRQDQGLVTLRHCQDTRPRASDSATGSGDKIKGWRPFYSIGSVGQDQELVTLQHCQETRTRAGDPATGSGGQEHGLGEGSKMADTGRIQNYCMGAGIPLRGSTSHQLFFFHTVRHFTSAPPRSVPMPRWREKWRERL